MASKHQMTGMLGVFLTAAELTRRDLVVSLTSRSARGADLLVTDQNCRRTWSVQVKTNRRPASFWLINKSFADETSTQHIYVFVNLRGEERPDFYVVPSKYVARVGRVCPSSTGTIFYAFDRVKALPRHRDPQGWTLFSS